MVTITVGEETFEAETLADAQKAARKAERKALAERKAREAARDVAQGLARSAAFHLYETGLRPDGPPRGIRLYQVGEPYFGADRLKREDNGDTVTYETSEGRATFEHYGYRMHGLVRNGAGFDLAVILRDAHDAERYDLLAVGVADGQVGFVQVSQLDWRVFDRAEEAVIA